MTSVYNYTFNNLSRIGEDQCTSTQKEVLNKAHGNYMTNNMFLRDCGMRRPIAFATQQPNIFFKGGVGNNVGGGGCVVDDNSHLTIGSIQTNPKCRISLQQRPYLTVPFLGRGPSKPALESVLQQGDRVSNKKSCNTVTEMPFLRENTPLLPSLQETIQNPQNLVEGAAADGWIRGGLPTRDLIRDQEYFDKFVPK